MATITKESIAEAAKLSDMDIATYKIELKELLEDVVKLLDEKQHFLVLNVYSLGFSSLIIENLMKGNLKKNNLNIPKMELGEIYIPSTQHKKLPLGVYCRF